MSHDPMKRPPVVPRKARRFTGRQVAGVVCVVAGMGAMVGLIAFPPVSFGMSFETLSWWVIGSAALAVAGLALT